MSEPPTFTTALVDGKLIVERADGKPMTQSEDFWIRVILRNGLRSSSGMIRRRQNVFSLHGEEVMGVRFTISHIIRQLSALRVWMRMPWKVVEDIAGLPAANLIDYGRGRSRPALWMVERWADALQHSLILVPHAVEKQVREIIDALYDDVGFKIPDALEYIRMSSTPSTTVKEEITGLKPRERNRRLEVERKLHPAELEEFDLTTSRHVSVRSTSETTEDPVSGMEIDVE